MRPRSSSPPAATLSASSWRSGCPGRARPAPNRISNPHRRGSSMDDRTRAVLGHVDKRELVDLASALIRIPSFKTEETAVVLFLETFFRERGYDVELQEIERGRFQTIATLRGTGGGARLMLNGHTDINALTMRWRRDPWTPSLEGDRLYGHGVQNMKGGLARSEERRVGKECRSRG